MLKKIMQSAFMQTLIGSFVAAYMVFVKYSTRWEFDRADISAPVIKKGQGLIALTWHSRFLMLNCAWNRKTGPHLHVLISRSRDGEIVAKTCQFLGLSVIRGSAKKITKVQDKGGEKAGRDIIGTLDSGCLLYTSPSPRDLSTSRMPSSA